MNKLNRTRLFLLFILFLQVLFFCGCANIITGLANPLSKNAIAPVVAVTSFENRSGFAGQWSLGSGMADLLVSELVKSRNFVVVERKNLRAIVNELKMQKDGLFRKEGKVDTGRLINARYLVRGVINDFSQISSFSIGAAIRSFLFNWKNYKARVALTLTIIDIESGEIIDSVQCEGIAKARQAYAHGKYKNVAFGGDVFFKTPLGKATEKAIRKGVKGVIQKMPTILWTPMIALTSKKGGIVINGGSDRKIKVGATYQVKGKGQPVTDPATGNLISIIPGATVGIIKIVEVTPEIAYAEIVEGSGFKRGQRLIYIPPNIKK